MLKATFPLLLLVAACAQPVVTEYNGDSIRITGSDSTVTPQILAEAQRICRTQGLQAEYASTLTYQSSFTYSHLFLCLSQTKPNAGLGGIVGRSSVSYLESTSSL